MSPTLVKSLIEHTPWLDIQRDNGLGSGLGLALLLLLVFSQSLVSDSGGLGVILLVIRCEEIDFIIILLSSSSWCLRWV
jgi:hypothetical protein